MQKVTNLYEAKRGKPFTVASVPNISLLTGLGLRVGTKIAVQNRFSLGGPVILRVEDAFSIAVGKDVATQIAVGEQ